MFSHQVDKKLSLSLLEVSDAGELLELISSNRPCLKKWLSWVDNVKEIKDAASFIERSRKQFAANKGFQSAIRCDQKIVGVIGLHEIDWEDRKTEIGYWLDRRYQGRGIITRACKSLLDYSFYTLKLNRVEIHCAEGNKKSQGIPERLGFKIEGVIREAQRLDDRFVNHIIYGLLSREWPPGDNKL